MLISHMEYIILLSSLSESLDSYKKEQNKEIRILFVPVYVGIFKVGNNNNLLNLEI